MKRRRGTLILNAILIVQFKPAGVLVTTSAADSTSSAQHMMCGRGGHHVLSSAAYRNTRERYGSAADSAQSESNPRFEDLQFWGAVWK